MNWTRKFSEVRRSFALIDTAGVVRDGYQLGQIALRAFYNQCHTINRLPDECLSAIFLMGAESGPENVGVDMGFADDKEEIVDEEVVHKAIPFGLLVSHVCRCWRDVALNTGQLWTRIEIFDPPPLDYLRWILEHSKSCSLQIIFDMSLRNSRRLEVGWHERLAEVLNVLTPHLPRCSDLVVKSPEKTPVNQVFLAFEQVNEPLQLHTLKILLPTFRSSARPTSGLSQWNTKLVELMRRVKILHLEGFYFPWTNPVYTNLTHLRILDIPWSSADRLDVAQFETILRGCPSLEYLDLNGADIEEGEMVTPHRTSSIAMSCLRTIKLTAVELDTLRNLFHLITAPVVGALGIHSLIEFDDALFDTPDPIATAVSDLFPTPSQSLWCLSLSDRSLCFALTTMPTLLQLVPHITSLELGHSVALGDLMEEMIVKKLCPKLESLLLDGCTSAEFSKTMQRFIQSRLEKDSGLRPIRRLRAINMELDPNFVDWLDKRIPDFTWAVSSDQ